MSAFGLLRKRTFKLSKKCAPKLTHSEQPVLPEPEPKYEPDFFDEWLKRKFQKAIAEEEYKRWVIKQQQQ